MLDLSCLSLDDLYVKHRLQSVLYDPQYTLGRLLKIDSLEVLSSHLQKAFYINSSTQVDKEVHYYETETVGEGYVSSISKIRLKKLMMAGLVSGSTEVTLKYRYGNLHCYIDLKDINLSILKTNIISIACNTATKQLYHVVIGSPVRCNRLYHLEHFDGVKGTVEKALRMESIDTYHFYDAKIEFSDIPH